MDANGTPENGRNAPVVRGESPARPRGEGATFSARVEGTPGVQGSFRAVVDRNNKDRAVLKPMNKKLKPWREAVVCQCRLRLARAGRVGAPSGPLFPGGVALHVALDVILPRLKSLPSRGPTPPPVTRSSCDLDKHCRAVGDALTLAGVIGDDSQIVSWSASKRYAAVGEEPGALITVMPALPPAGGK